MDNNPEVAEAVDDGGELGIVDEDAQEFASRNFGPAPAVETVCVFPKNGARCEIYAIMSSRIYSILCFKIMIAVSADVFGSYTLQWFPLEKRLN